MYTTRSNQQVIFESFESPYITAILGPRRVGKSTLMQQFAQETPDRVWVTLNMDSLQHRQQVTEPGLLTMIEEECRFRVGSHQKVWVAIDEAQKCPDLFDQIKIIYDTFKGQDQIKFILTGSAHLELHRLSAESLAGRIELFHLQDFTLRESLLLTKKPEVLPKSFLLEAILLKQWDQLEEMHHTLAPLKNDLTTALEEQLLWGGLPESLLSQSVAAKQRYLSNYLETYLEKDIRHLHAIGDLNRFRQLMDILAEQTGSVRNQQKFVDALGGSRDTTSKYLSYMLATFMYQELYPFTQKTMKRMVKSPKGYLQNNGMISYLTGLDTLSVLQKSGLIGHRLENWFLKELTVVLERLPRRSQIYYWRTANGAEVDFVVQQKPDIFPFEVTYSPKVQSQKMNNLKSFMSDYPEASRGFYVYGGPWGYDAEHRIYLVPFWAMTG